MNITAQRMFGGHGLYCGEKFFGIIHAGKLYFKVNDATKAKYLEAGMEPFKPSAKQVLKSYYQVPSDILESAKELKHWAKEAIGA